MGLKLLKLQKRRQKHHKIKVVQMTHLLYSMLLKSCDNFEWGTEQTLCHYLKIQSFKTVHKRISNVHLNQCINESVFELDLFSESVDPVHRSATYWFNDPAVAVNSSLKGKISVKSDLTLGLFIKQSYQRTSEDWVIWTTFMMFLMVLLGPFMKRKSSRPHSL